MRRETHWSLFRGKMGWKLGVIKEKNLSSSYFLSLPTSPPAPCLLYSSGLKSSNWALPQPSNFSVNGMRMFPPLDLRPHPFAQGDSVGVKIGKRCHLVARFTMTRVGILTWSGRAIQGLYSSTSALECAGVTLGFCWMSILIQKVGGGTWGSAFLISSPVMPGCWSSDHTPIAARF